MGNDLGYAITEASKVEQDCHGEHTECGQDLGSLVRGVAQIVPEAWIAAETCKKEKFVNCALYSMLSGLSSLEVAQGVEYSLRSCIHKHDGPSKFDCLADAAGSVHGLVTTVGAVISSAKWCKSGQEECGEEVCTTFMNVGYTAVKISQVLHTCRGKNTACAEELGFVVQSLGQAGLNLISARQACKKLDAGCVATLVFSAGAVLDFASKASSAIRACHKGAGFCNSTSSVNACESCNDDSYCGGNSGEWNYCWATKDAACYFGWCIKTSPNNTCLPCDTAADCGANAGEDYCQAKKDTHCQAGWCSNEAPSNKCGSCDTDYDCGGQSGQWNYCWAGKDPDCPSLNYVV